MIGSVTLRGKPRRTRPAFVGAFLSCALVVAACSGSTAPSGSAAASSGPSAQETPSEQASQPAPSPTTPSFAGITLNVLTIDYHKDWEFTAPELVPAFEKATGAKVNVTYIPFDSRQTKFASIIATQDPTFDVIVGTVLESTGYINMYDDLRGKINDATLSDMTTTTAVGNSVYVLPILDGAQILYWNKDMFQQAGLDPTKGPATWDEFFADCAKLKQAFPTKSCYDLPLQNNPAAFNWWVILMNTANGQMWDASLKNVAFNNPQGLAAMKVFQQLTTSPYVDKGSFALRGSDDAATRFTQETTPFLIAWSDNYGRILQDKTKSKVVDKAAFGVLPGIPPAVTGSINGWEGYGVNKWGDASKKAAAYAFIEWLVGIESQKVMSKAFGFLPVRKSLLNSPSAGVGDATWPVCAAEYNTGQVSVFGAPFYIQATDAAGPILIDVAQGKLEPQAALDKMASALQTAINQYYAR